MVLRPDQLEEGREALVQPAVRPVAAGQQVAEPLVRQLVRDQAVGVLIEAGAAVVEDRVRDRGGADVLHAAEDEVLDDHLRVLRVRVAHADAVGEQAHHLGRILEGLAAILFLANGHVIDDGDAVPFLAQLRVLAGDHARQVGDVGDVLAPVEGARAVGMLVDAGQLADRDNGVRLAHGHVHLAGRHLVRRVVARKPVARSPRPRPGSRPRNASGDSPRPV